MKHAVCAGAGFAASEAADVMRLGPGWASRAPGGAGVSATARGEPTLDSRRFTIISALDTLWERMSGGIIISCRRDDFRQVAGRLANELAQAFGRKKIFRDVEIEIEIGVDFTQALEKTLAECEVMLVLIDRHWLDIRDARGWHRLDQSEDWIRSKVVTALKRNFAGRAGAGRRGKAARRSRTAQPAAVAAASGAGARRGALATPGALTNAMHGRPHTDVQAKPADIKRVRSACILSVS
jgi:hypothetical protein